MRLTETTTMGVRARVSRLTAGAALMSASCVLAATIHLAPAIPAATAVAAGLAQADLSTQSPAASTLAEDSTQSAPGSRDRLPSAREKARAQRKQQEDLIRRQAAQAAATFNNRQFTQQMEDAQRQAAKSAEWINSP